MACNGCLFARQLLVAIRCLTQKTTGCLRETQDLLRGQQATAFTKEQEAQIVQDRLTSLEQECAVLVAQRDELVNDLDQHRQQSLTDKESWENEVMM